MKEIRVLNCSNHIRITKMINKALDAGWLFRELMLREGGSYVAIIYKD